MEAVKGRPNISANIDIEIRQDPDLRAVFDFWVRNVYLDRPKPIIDIDADGNVIPDMI